MEPFIIGIIVLLAVIATGAAYAVRRARTQRRLAMEAELIAAAEPRMASRLELIRRRGALPPPEEEPVAVPLHAFADELQVSDAERAPAFDSGYLEHAAALATARQPEAYDIVRDSAALPELEVVPEVEPRFLALEEGEGPDGGSIDSDAASEAEAEAEREAAEIAAITAGDTGLPLATRIGDLRERRRRLRLGTTSGHDGMTERMRRTRALTADAVETRRRFRRDTIAAAVIFLALAAASVVVPRVQPLPAAAPRATASPSAQRALPGAAAPAVRASSHPIGE